MVNCSSCDEPVPADRYDYLCATCAAQLDTLFTLQQVEKALAQLSDHPFRAGNNLVSFLSYMILHPDQRFWQGVRNWSDADVVMRDGVDTFFWEGRTSFHD